MVEEIEKLKAAERLANVDAECGEPCEDREWILTPEDRRIARAFLHSMAKSRQEYNGLKARVRQIEADLKLNTPATLASKLDEEYSNYEGVLDDILWIAGES